MRKGIGGATGDGLLSVLLVFVLFAGAGAQPGSPPYENQFNNYAKFSPSMAIIIVVLIAALFFMGFFSIYLRHCSGSSGAGGLSVRRALSMRNRRAAAARGLDATVIETFPTFTYSEVKDHKIGIDALECAVCLNEFGEEETLRLIPKCDHVFHPECIDAWLASHVTCPVCRANLVPSNGDEPIPASESVNEANVPVGGENVERIDSSRNEEIVIQVEEDRRPVDQEGGAAQQSSVEYPNRPQRSWSMKIFGFGKFRSHSTGHSMLPRGENLEKFTLKLPEEVRKEVITRAALNRTASSVMSSKPRGGEGSSRGGRSYQRMEKLDTGAKSDRWILFSRGLSLKSPKVVAAESSDAAGRRVPVRMPSFNCLEPRTESDDMESRPLSSGKPPLPPPA